MVPAFDVAVVTGDRDYERCMIRRNRVIEAKVALFNE